MEMTRGRQGRRRVDADGAWKRILGEMLHEFVAFALPDLHAAIDWRREPVFLEQELRPVLRQAALARRVTDVVVQVWLLGGETTWLLVHVEVQGQTEADFAARMYTYAALLNLRFLDHRARRRKAPAERPPPPAGLVGIAVLTDTSPQWRPDEYRWGWGEYGISYRFRTLKLADWRAQAAALAGDAPPFAWVIESWLAAQDAGRDAGAQADVRRAIGRRLLLARRQRRLTAAQVLAILIFLGALSGLPDALLESIDHELGLTEEATMPEVLSYFERRALERGLEQGRERGLEQGRTELVLLLLAERCGPLDAQLREQVANLSGEAVVALGKALLNFQGLADLRRWLEQHADRG
jgi:hypothetical protein